VPCTSLRSAPSRPCVNPAHLETVTRVEHVRRTYERMGKNRRHLDAAYLRSIGLTYGEIAELTGYSSTGAHQAVTAAISKGLVAADDVPRRETLEDDDREAIVFLRALGVPCRELARWYGIHESQISRVSRGLRSGHVA
jgi:hypothetical protein